MQQRSDVKNNFQAVVSADRAAASATSGEKRSLQLARPGLVSAPSELLEIVRYLAGIATRFTAKYAGSTLQSLVAEKRSFNFSSSAAFRESGGNTSHVFTGPQKLNFNFNS